MLAEKRAPDPGGGKAHGVGVLNPGALNDDVPRQDGRSPASSEARLTDDEITDLVEAVVDELDLRSVAPSVGTGRVGDDIDMTIGVAVDDEDQFEALRHGAEIIGAGLRIAIGIGPCGSWYR